MSLFCLFNDKGKSRDTQTDKHSVSAAHGDKPALTNFLTA